MTSLHTANTFRKYHRLLGFFLAGVMAIYACSGVLLVFRDTNFLKFEHTSERQLATGLSADDLGQNLRLKGFRVDGENAAEVLFPQGRYDKASGVATVTQKAYPAPLQKMVNLHKATSDSPLFFMNVFFGVSLLFFAISPFFMFLPKLPAFRTGLKFAGAGACVALVVVLAS